MSDGETGEIILLHCNFAIRKQVEFYFGEPNYSKDKYLQQFISAENQLGYVPIIELLHFPRMKVLLNDYQNMTPMENVSIIAASLQGSRIVALSPSKTMVRPTKLGARGGGGGGGGGSGGTVSTAATKPRHGAVCVPLDEQLVFEVKDYFQNLPFHFYNFVHIHELHAYLYEEKNIRIDRDTLVRHLKQLPDLVMNASEKMVRKNDVARNMVENPTPVAGVEAVKTRSFSVMTYNILADCLSSFQFPYATKEVLNWENRMAGIIREIEFYSPDIVCMQELQSLLKRNEVKQTFKTTEEIKGESDESVNDHLLPVTQAMADAGYTYKYLRKKRHNAPQRRGTDIGNAVFWKTSSFSFIEHEQVLLEKIIWERGPDQQSKLIFANGFPQVALFVQLEHVATGKPVVVATTHICASFQTPYVQLVQVMTCLDQLKKYAHVPIILAGDFNSVPQTATYHLLSKGCVSTEDPTVQAVKKLGVKIPFKNLKHELALKSVYSTVLGKEPQFTNLTHEFVGTLDYIWYTQKSLTPVAVLDIPPREAFISEIGMPNSSFPSDHLHMFCILHFT